MQPSEFQLPPHSCSPSRHALDWFSPEQSLEMNTSKNFAYPELKRSLEEAQHEVMSQFDY